MISLDALAEILVEEGVVTDAALLPDLAGSLHAFAVGADHSERDALDAWERATEEMEEDIEDDESDSGEEGDE